MQPDAGHPAIVQRAYADPLQPDRRLLRRYGVSGTSSRLRSEHDAMSATNLAICLVCPRRQTACNGPCACTVDGRDILEHARSGDCPDSRFDDTAGGGIASPPAHAVDRRCLHRGGVIDKVLCLTCSGSVYAHIEACSIHGRCTQFIRPVDGVRFCGSCPDRITKKD